MSVETWTPVPFNLRHGIPFPYSPSSISEISKSEAFRTGINLRDAGACIICGEDTIDVLQHAHIVPRVEHNTWEDLRSRQFIPVQAKSVEHEARNGILLCPTHHAYFERFMFYIRWVPQVRRFVLINHSSTRALNKFHGRAVRLFPGSTRLPFHGALLIHEMRVRAFWPFAEDPTISLPIPWQTWMNIDPHTEHYDDHDDQDITGNRFKRKDTGSLSTASPMHQSGGVSEDQLQRSSDPLVDDHAILPQTVTLTNPFTNPAELEALTRSFAEQPNFKTAAIEDESWEGTAEENILKWQGLVGGAGPG